MKPLENKTYSQVLSETADYFNAQGVNILGEGYREIASNAALFESYVDNLTEGCSANSTAEIAQLMSNTNAQILRESSMTGIQPVASLSMPVIRKLWPMFALKNAIDTEVAKAPRFVVAYTKPYMFRGDAERIDLPRGLASAGEALSAGMKKDYTGEETVTFTKPGEAYVVDWSKDEKVNLAGSPSNAKLQPLDELVFVSAKVGDKNINIGKRLGVYGNGVYEFEGGQLIVQFDGKNRKATFAAVGTFTESVVLVVKAAVSSEYNESSWSVGFDIARQDVDIPTGQHLNAPLPIEALNDMMALYQIDGTKEVTDLMTNVFSMKLDIEILDFLRDSYANQPGNEAYADHLGAEEFTVTFDCKPAAGFAGSPKAWREELKPLIDHLAQRIKQNTYLQSGVFSIVCNPIDAQILANVDWSYRGGQGGNIDGVDVDYSVGTYVGANAYKVVASANVPQGAMYLVFTPSQKTQLTYKYYPYTFGVEMGYVDPNRSRTPSIMMTKRHTFFNFLPAIGAIIIEHNDASSHFVQHGSWNVAE